MEAKRLFIKRDVDGESQLFPSSGTPAVVGTFTYTAKRMGGAPSITATVYYPTPLDKSWTHEEYVELLGEKYYATSIPSSSKDNATLLYKHDITFASRREVLDNTLFFDVVSDNDEDTSGGDKYRSNQTNFTFGGDITEFVSRINSSMKYCGVPYSVVIDEGYASTDVKEVSFESQYLTEVLQLINTTYELDYYWVGSVCHIGKLQYDLTGEPVEYGRANALTSVSKDNSNAKIVDMITGYGSSDNIPYYYPNEDAYGAAVYETENFDKSLVAGVSLGKLLKWDNSIYGKTLTLCKNSSESYTGDIFGLSKYSVYVSDNVAWDEDMVSSGSGASSADIKATCSLGERIITGFGTRTSTMAVSSSVIWLFFEFNGQVGDTINLDGIEFSSTEASGSNHLGLELSHEKVFYVGEGMDMASALSAMRTAYVATIKGNGDKTYTNASGTASSNYWAFGDNIGTDFSEYTKSSDKVCTLTRSGKVTVVIGCKVCATNIIVAKGTGKMNTVTTSMTGSIICTHMPQSVYYFDNGEGGTLAYGDSGIEINGIESIPNKTLAFTFDGTDWVGSVDSSDSASKIRITGRTWISPSQNLMPSVYRSSNGSERFYYAKNDTYLLPDDSGKYYSFVNEYKSGNPHQGSVEFSDIKPTISGMRNDVIQADGLGQLFGEIADVAFDSNDSDATDSDGNYIHSYFYIKLHKFSGDYGFDLFSHALASDNAKINLVKSNGCPACSFDIQCTASKDNSKMYNCVSTDGAGNLKSVRTDYNDYIFKNDGDAYSDTFNQDSTTTELWIALKKEDSTLGIVMPNASGNFKPQKGDLFVITGIRPPKVLVTAAEKRLDDALIKYMSENNEDQFDYSIKFSRIFLQEHQDFANKLNENSKIAVRYAGETHEFYVSDYTVKVDDNALAEVTVELSETLETSSSELKATIDSVKGETVAQLQGLINGGGSFNATVADKLYLSKLSDDTAQGLITFLQGLVAKSVADLQKGATFGKDSFITELGHAVLNTIRSIDYNNAAEAGFSIEKDSMGRYQAFITNLTVWGKAVFNELEIRKLSYAGGNIYLSGAGSKIIKAVPVKKVTKTSAASDGTETVAVAWEPCEVMDDDCAGWKCYLLADDGTTATMNFWQEGDQARCRTMGEITSSASYENVSNRSFWRTIPDDGVSTFNEKIYGTKTETYTDADGNELTRETVVELYDGQMFAWIVIGKHALAFDGVTEGDPNTPDLQDAPQAGDTIVLDGNRHRGTDGAYDKKDRQNVITLETTGDYAPRIACYADITEYKHTVTKGGKEVSLSVFETSPSGGTKVNSSRFEWTSDDGSTVNIINYRGDWSSSSTYHKNDQVNHANAMWVCMADSGVDVTEEPSDTAVYWKKVLSGGKGEKGDDAVTYEVQVSSYSEYVGSGRIYGLQFQFVKVTGATRQTVTDVREIGCVIAINTAAYIYTDAASYINEGSSHFLFSSYPVANVTMDEADNITVKMYLSTDTEKENPVAVANFANGKQGADGMGALEISVSPDTVIFDTDDNGLVSSSASKTATISCYRDGKKVENVEYALPSSGHPDCNATISTANSIATVTISGIATDATYGVSKTSGTVKVQVYDVDNGRYYYPTVKFAVNVAKFNGSMVANNKKFETVYNELTNNGSSTDLTWYESKIEQTARNISLKVQEKNVGRRNLLVGSAFRKQESGFCKIIGGYISINGGYEGTNCVRAVNQYSGTRYYYGVFWDGSQGGSSVKIERGKKYILSVWVKCDNVNATIALEPIFTDKQTSATRTSARPKQTKQYFKVTNANEWELLQSVIDTSLNQDGSTNTLYDCLAVNVWCSHALSGVTVNAWFCRPMLEEGEEYNGWTQSEQDYDYVGGNLLDNTGTLTESGNLATVNGTVTEGGMGESASIKRTLPTTASEIDPLAFSTSGMGIKAGEDYILSFYAKADSDTTAGKLQCYFHPSSGGIYTEDSAGGNDNSRNPSDGNLLYGIVPTTAWKRYWVHWRPTASDMQYVRFRVLPRGTSKGSYSSTTTYAVDDYVLYNGTYWRCKAATKGNAPTSSSSYWEATVYDVSIAQPKLEVGATMTEWTEKRADMVDKQALLATGIDIDNKIVTVTADKFRVQNNSGEQTALVTGDGKLTTSLIDANTVVAQGIKTQELEAQNLKVTGSSKFGIWSIGTDSKWGDVIQASDFTDLNGVTYVGSMMQYTPSFVRGGSSAGAYMRVGPYTAEFGQVVDNGYNGIWFGYAARIVCQGSANSWDLPTGYVYNTGYSPTAYIYSKGSGENPAFAINRANGGAAIQTNGAVRCRGFGGGVTTVSSSTTLDNNAYFVRCTNSSGITVTLPSDPVEGQTVIIVQAGGSVAISGGSKTIWARGQTGGTSSVTSGMTGQFNIFVYDGTQWNATMTNGTY